MLHNNLHSRVFIFSLAMLAVIAAQLTVSLYLPALPTLSTIWHLTAGQTQLTLSALFITLGVSQLFYGPLSDHLGRRPLVIVGVVIITFASIWASLADSFYSLLGARIFQGLGGGALAVVSRVIVRDLYSDESALRRAISVFAIAASLTPALAPSIGGFLTEHFGWRSNFITLSIYGVILTAVIFLGLKETHPAKQVNNDASKHRAVSLTGLYQDYKKVLSYPLFYYYTALIVLTYISIMVCLSNAPFILEKKLGLSIAATGYFMLVQPVSFLIGNILQNRFGSNFSAVSLLRVSGIVLGLVAASFLLQNYLHMISLPFVLLTLSLVGFSTSLGFVNATAEVLALFKNEAGTATAISGLFQMTGVALSLAIISHFHLASITFLGMIYLVIFALFALTLFALKIRQYRCVSV